MDNNEAIHRVLLRLEKRWTPERLPHEDYWDYQPLPISELLIAIDTIQENKRGNKYLEIGCGIGTRLLHMHLIGFDCTGIDIYEPYIDAARELVPEANLININLFDFKDFDYDVVYMYNPCKEEIQQKADKLIVDNISSGTLLFLPYRPIPEGMEQIYHYVSIKL